eukprot:CAMPEP_0183443034 /NCGR_PEP_ID=MMETSP0370-20130417/90339_1 /TAXON_ID=268820 /ORGANISM="Peridinium aciculiferum, Strain PAER-2" /LENGTH=354 /DNA_ID=CAMNT_0025632879 /DNA_START=41 /DNA_END=1101 /DNA_ORIENTATION=+
MAVRASKFLLLLAAPACVTGTQTGAGMQHIDDGSHIDVAGLKGALDSGGADALAKMLQAMQMARGGSGAGPEHDKQFHIARDASGFPIYDFREPPTTKRPQVMPTMAPVALSALKVPAVPPPGVPAVPGVPNFQAQLASMSQGVGGLHMNTPGMSAPAMQNPPVAPAQPSTMSLGVKSVQQSPQTFVEPPPSTFNMVGGQGQLQGGNQMEALARGLETIRERIDSLAGEAVAAVQGQTMQLPQGSMPAMMAQARAQGSAVSDKIEQQMEAFTKRMVALEQDNKDLHKQITAQAGQLSAEKTLEAQDEKKLAALQADNSVLKANVTKLMLRRRPVKHLRKVAKVQQHKPKPAAGP